MSPLDCNLALRSLLALLASLLALLLSPCLGAGAAAAELHDDARLLQAMRQGGVAVLIRHSATDPGAGDPPGFRLNDCATQRNLSDAGRAQARRLGDWFRSNGIVPGSVRASPWCRTRETATLAFGRFEDWSPLSNLFGDRSRQQDHAVQVRRAIADIAEGHTAVLVSHGISIDAFIGVYLSQGEFVVVRPSGGDGGVEVLGRKLIP